MSWFGFAGAPRPGAAWPAGPYKGEVVLVRDANGTPVRAVLEPALALR